ncbi:hypothetical protein EB796_013104 [Bugula neritina]|uniref:Uncharacterized protein n=1 Tax=Bugula neritina TaxID=10212 RepID=A0A7J7JQF4_BUGNE|nr:hypothetical protein EB796_013104 [Bugula neritina]
MILFVRYKGLQAMKSELHGCNVSVSLGNEMGTAIIKGDDAEMISKLQERITKYPESLTKRQTTVNTAMWEFLDSRTSRAFGHINGILDEYSIYCRTTTAAGKSGDHKLVLLITESENRSRLNEAEKKLRDYIICEDSVVASMELGRKLQNRTLKCT